MDTTAELIRTIALVGRENPSCPRLDGIEPFSYFFNPDGALDRTGLDRRDGACTRREVLARFLLLNAVLDQGPDTEGVRMLLAGVTNSLYRREVRFLHTPLAFFKDLGLAIDNIVEKHATVSGLRSAVWGEANQANPKKKAPQSLSTTWSLGHPPKG